MRLEMPDKQTIAIRCEDVRVGENALPGTLVSADRPTGIVVFTDNRTSDIRNVRNLYFAKVFQFYGLGTLMCDLLTEQEAHDRTNARSIELLVSRLGEFLSWIEQREDLSGIPIGLLGSSVGAAAALSIAAHDNVHVDAIVSRAGRPDLALTDLPQVRAATLLIVGSKDPDMVESNRCAMNFLQCKKRLDIIPNATHLFTEPGALDVAAGLAAHWFERHLRTSERS
jgi:putative phosphoribosyl transferase